MSDVGQTAAAQAQHWVVGADSVTAWDGEADVVVVGAGIAGSAAAVAAATAGARVTVLEKAAAGGGTFAKSAGAFWLPGNPGLAKRGVEDAPEQALRFIARCARPQSYDPDDAHLGLEPWEHELLRAYVERGPVIAAEMEATGAVTWDFPDWTPDYQTRVPENVVKFGRLGLPMAPDGSAMFTGELQAQRLLATLDRLGVDVRCEHAVDAVVVDGDGAVVGVRAHAPGGTRHIRAVGGVVFGSGGFTHDAHLRRTHLPSSVMGGAAVHTNTGDFVRIAISLGVPLYMMGHPWMAPIPLEAIDEPWVCNVFVSPGDSMVYLNRYGRRVVNEKGLYNEVARVFQTWDPWALEYPNLLLFMVFDERVRQLWAPPPEYPHERLAPRWALDTLGNYLHDERFFVKGDDLEALAAGLQERLAGLAHRTGHFTLDESFVDGARASIARFNALAQAGVDEDFHRGETPIELTFFRDRRPGNDLPNPTMFPLADQGPYYAQILVAGTLDTKGGPRIDTEGRVLGLAGRPVPGLYGAGNCIASPFAQGYPAGGTPNGSALIFGFSAGRHAAARATA